eukprot:scaffold686_cov342-Prasinococcus_capsulatus_cf.AAC.6
MRLRPCPSYRPVTPQRGLSRSPASYRAPDSIVPLERAPGPVLPGPPARTGGLVGRMLDC